MWPLNEPFLYGFGLVRAKRLSNSQGPIAVVIKTMKMPVLLMEETGAPGGNH